MTTFPQHVEDYLRLRRAFGYKLVEPGRTLPRFAAHMEATGAEFVTVDAALAWALEPDVTPGSVVRPMRMLVVRGFARYMAGIDPRTEIPPAGLLPFRQRWRAPFIYSDADVVALMGQASRSIPDPLRAATFETLIGLFASTGLRIGEAINLRLTAIRSLFGYAALRHPEHAAVIQRVPSIPSKRFERRTVTFLTAEESQALIDAPDQLRWEGRDRAMLILAIQTGLRVSELVGLGCGDVALGTGSHVRIEGKGRKQRSVPLTGQAQAVLAVWLAERCGQPQDPLFPTRTGRRLSRSRAPGGDSRRHCDRAVRVAEGQAASPACAQAQLRNGAAAGRSGLHRHRVVAGTRGCPVNHSLHPRRHDNQGASPRARHASVCHTRPLQVPRFRARLP